MSDASNQAAAATDETSPKVPEGVERDKPTAPVAETVMPVAEKPVKKTKKVKAASTKEPTTAPAAEPATKKAAAKKATVAAEPAPKKRGRPKGSKNKDTKEPTVTAVAPKKRGRPPKAEKSATKVSTGKQGRQWPVLPFVLYINVQTRQPKALAIAIRKTLWKYTLRGPRSKGEAAE